MSIKEQEKRVRLLEKEVALHKEILELKRLIHELERPKEIGPSAPTDHWPYWQPWCDGTGDPLPPQNVTIC